MRVPATTATRAVLVAQKAVFRGERCRCCAGPQLRPAPPTPPMAITSHKSGGVPLESICISGVGGAIRPSFGCLDGVAVLILVLLPLREVCLVCVPPYHKVINLHGLVFSKDLPHKAAHLLRPG